MENIKEWFVQYKWYAMGLVFVLIVFAFVLRMAAKAYKKHYANFRKEEANIKHLLALKEKYKNLTEEAIADGSEDELLEGVALSYQLALQKADDMSARFAEFSKEKQYIYALDVFVSDKSVRTFFKENGRELTEIIVPALKLIGLEAEAKEAEKIRIMFDETDETTSMSEKTIETVEAYFTENNVLTKIKQAGAKYIKNNPAEFV